jgi:integrase
MTGARRSEALNTKWEHINYSSKTWLIPLAKSGQPKHVYLSDAAITVLERLRAEVFTDHNNPYILLNPSTGRPYKCLHAAWKLVLTAAGLPDLQLHDLRHSYASTLVNNGVSIYDVQKLLDHNSIKTTQRYAHLSSEHPNNLPFSKLAH